MMPAEIRARMQAEAIRKSREDLAKKAAVNPYRPPPTDAELQAEATARARTPPPVTPKPVDAGLPPEARAAAGLPMENPPVHRAQIKPIPGEIDTQGFLARVRILPVTKKLSKKTRMAVARAIVWFIGKAPMPEQAVRGIAQASYQSIATAADCSPTQVWRSVRLFRAHGILDIFNVTVREGNDLLRDANAYSLRGFTKAIPAVLDAVKDAVTGAFDRASEQVRRFAHVWDMRANRSGPRPAPTPRTHSAPKPRTHPAPA